METGPQLKVSSDRLVKPGIEPATPGLQGKRFIHYTTAAPSKKTHNSSVSKYKIFYFEVLGGCRYGQGVPNFRAKF